jgi:alkylation response protein AidB-like acyl-CoA dehydrogenase
MAANPDPARAGAPTVTPALPDSRGTNLFRADPGFAPLLALYLEPALHAHLAPHLDRLGALAGDRLDELAGIADRNPPQLHHRDRSGADRQWIEKHPAYAEMERIAFAEYGLAAMSHRPGVLGWPRPLPPAAKYALSYVFVQAEFGLCCPVSMTDALTRTLAKFGAPELANRYLPGLTSTDLDALTQGAMFMTEQGAGSDVGATATVARRAGAHWTLWGDKWFCSNADADLALVLARPEGGAPGTKGLSLFLLPRLLPDGTANRYRIVRLKAKLGTRDMASGEIRLEGALAYLVGEPQRGFVQMADMINTSRLSNGMRAAGMMRRALTEALFVAARRSAFGRPIVELPLMRRQLLKLMVPTEAARSMLFYAADELAAADAGDEAARRRVRILTPLLKFRACRDARRVTGDAMEVRGGCGYIEEWPDARLLRDAHLGSIWEGTSNIVALDVARAVRKERALEALAAGLDRLVADARIDGRLGESLGGARAAALRCARETAESGDDTSARQAATGLYYATAATVLAAEGARLAGGGDARRLLLAQLVLEHRIAPRDPRARADAARESAFADLLLDEAPVPPARAAELLR